MSHIKNVEHVVNKQPEAKLNTLKIKTTVSHAYACLATSDKVYM